MVPRKMDLRLMFMALFVVASFPSLGSSEMIAKCPPEYVQRGGTGECYLFHKHGKRTWNDANKYCERERGNLVRIGSATMRAWLALQLVETGLVGDSSDFWIDAVYDTVKEKWFWDSTGKEVNVGYLPVDPQHDGVYGTLTTNSTLKGHPNSALYHFICHTNIETPYFCDFEEGWHQANDRCYASPEGATSWSNADVMCQQLGGFITTLNGDQEQKYAYDMSQMWRDNIWIGMTELESAGQYQWAGPNSDYRKWNKDLSMPVSLDGFGSAVIDYEDASGRWVTEIATNSHHYLCEKDKGGCVVGWELHKDSCYYFNSMESDKVTWTTANQLCIDVGANLAVIQTEDEDNYISSMMGEQNHLWIGLYSEPEDKMFYWVDGSHYYRDNFTKMTTTDETAAIDTGVRKCAYYQLLGLGTIDETSNWKPVECTEVNKFICEVPKGTNVFMNIPPKDQYCPEGWILDSDFCYFPSQEEVTWTAADKFCRENGGDLASVNSWIEQDYIREMLYGNSWIGLNDRRVEHEFVWSDGNKLVIQNWDSGQPSQSDSNCVEMIGSSGYWNDLLCSSLLDYVCKRPYSSTPLGPVTTTTPAPENKACGHNWVEDLNTGICYRVFTEFLMYEDARLHCQEQDYTDGQSKPDLVSISTAGDQIFVQGLLVNSQQTDPSFYIGLQNDYYDGLYWTDGDPVTFNNFADGEPDQSYTENCCEIYNDGVYEWNDVYCTDRRPFICEKKGTNFVLPPPTEAPIVDCPSGWEKFNQHCYYIADTSNRGSWQHAKDLCTSMYNSTLAAITNSEENEFLLSLLASTNDNLWIGLYATGDDGSFGWIDGTPLEYTNWLPGEPNNQDGYEPCGEMLSYYQGYSGVWNDIICTNLNRAACKMIFKTCPQSWSFDYGKCYYVSDNFETWDVALQKCKEVDGEATLVSIHSSDESSFLQSLIGDKVDYITEVWVGLHRNSMNEPWVWTDGSAVDFPNWDYGQPDENDTDFCAISAYYGGRMSNHECSYSSVYACEYFPTHHVGCEKDWLHYNGWCYYSSSRVSSDYITYEESYQACLDMDANLASIHSREENEFVSSVISGSYGVSWIGLNDVNSAGQVTWTDGSVVDYTYLDADSGYNSPSPICFAQDSYVAPREKWVRERCLDANNYVCKKEGVVITVEPATGCLDRDDLYHRGSCYRMVDYTVSYDTAKSQCPYQVEGSHLITIRDQVENAFLSAYYPMLGEKVWIGLEKEINPDGSVEFRWLDGTPFEFSNWGKYEPVQGYGDSVYASGVEETTGLWGVETGYAYYPYFCEYERPGYTSPAPPPTISVGPAYCAPGWAYNQATLSCYKLMTHGGQTQGLAEQNCVMYGGHLTSVATQEEEQFILRNTDLANFTYTTFWVGLILTENGYIWMDGSPTNYLYWANDQPDSHHGREDCVTAYKATLELSDMYCSSYYAYMCKAPQGMPPTTPPPITNSPDIPCPGTSLEDGWLLNGDHCYKVFSETVEAPRAWTDAQSFCQHHGSQLASIVNDEENSFIMSKVYFLTDYMLWLGGIADYDRVFHWSDGQEFVYINWNKGEPSNYYDQEDCISMYPGIQGYWNDDNCGRALGWICKRPSGNTVPPPPPTEAPIGHCPTGWIHAGNKCIKVNIEKTNFEAARSQCKSSGVNADLVSVHGPGMQAALTAILTPMGVTAWIGMKANGPFFWVDQTPVDFTNWGPGEPNNAAGNEFCVEALHNAAQWNDAACDKNRSSVCAQNVDSSLNTHNPFPMCKTPFDTYIDYTGRCYKGISDPKSWEAAEEYCKNDGAHLVTIESLSECSFVYLLAADSMMAKAWIGLNSRKDLEQYAWVSGYPVLYTNWGGDQPNITDDTARCVELSSTSSGLWYNSKCDQAKPFLCKYTEGTVPTPDPPANGKCPNNYWLNFGGGYCYLVEPEDKKSWNNANKACNQQGGFLVSIHSQTELDLIAHTTSTTNFNLWSGLIRQTNKEFIWSDGSAYDFMAWAENEPNNEGEECVEMYADNRQWNDASCDIAIGYVCKAAKVGGSGPDNPTDGPKTTPPAKPTIGKSGLTGGAVAGLVLACLALVAAVGLVWYSYQNRKAIEKPTRQPHPTASYDNDLYNPDDVDASTSSGPAAAATVRVVDMDGSVEFGALDTKA